MPEVKRHLVKNFAYDFHKCAHEAIELSTIS